MLSVLPIRITAPYIKWKPGDVVLVSGVTKSGILARKAGETFMPKAPMKRGEFATIAVKPENIHPDVIDGARNDPRVIEALRLREEILARKRRQPMESASLQKAATPKQNKAKTKIQ